MINVTFHVSVGNSSHLFIFNNNGKPFEMACVPRVGEFVYMEDTAQRGWDNGQVVLVVWGMTAKPTAEVYVKVQPKPCAACGGR